LRSCGITTAATPAPGSPAGQKVSRHSQLLRDLALPCKTSGNLLTLHLILHVVQVIELGLGAATDRTQSFVHAGLTTAYFPVTYSVPQGSVFGPLGFIAYTDDLTAVSDRHNVHSHMYADDTQLYDSSSLVDAESVRDRLTSCV